MAKSTHQHPDGTRCIVPWIITDKPHVAFYDVTKEMAQDFELYHNNINRPQMRTTIAKYCRDRVNNKWLLTHQAGAFDWNGETIDAQHRWKMIIETGLTTRMVICVGLDPEVRAVTDIGKKRNAADVLNLVGRKEATVRNVAVVRQMMNGLGKSATMQEVIDAYDLYKDAAITAIGFSPMQNVKNLTIGAVYGVLGRASFTVDHELLKDFMTVLVTGKGERGNKGHKSILLLHNYLAPLPSRGEGLNRTIYGYTETTLLAFLENEALTSLYISDEELFPLPEKMKKTRSRKLKIVEPVASAA